MRLSAAITLALTALLVVSTLGAIVAPSAAAPVGAERTPAHASVDLSEAEPPEPADPKQAIRIAVTADGDAIWTIESRYLLENEADHDSFEAYAAAVSAGDRDVGYDDETFERFLRFAEASTDREMSLEGGGWNEPRTEAVDDDNDHEIGVISYSVTWSNFTVVDGDHVSLGDAFRTDDGTWFPRLTADQRLVIERPANSTFEDVPRGIEDGALVWDGPYEFGEDELEVTFQVDGDDGTAPPDTGTGFTEGILSPTSIAAGIGLVVLLSLVGIGGYLLASRERLFGSNEDDRLGSAPKAATEDGESTMGRGADTSSVEFDDSSVDDPGSEEIDVELLSDEERVLRLLRQNGGRMKQAMIVNETGWSNAKVSQLLSKMDEDDEIEKLRIGRENLITLPEIDLTEIE